MSPTRTGTGRNRGRNRIGPRPSARATNYSQLRNPFPPMDVFTTDRIEANLLMRNYAGFLSGGEQGRSAKIKSGRR